MNIYPFLEAEKAVDHTVKRACELLKVSLPPTTRSAPTSPLLERVPTPS